ncbi:hypothetical protein OHR68_20210 [Spirillospora sp. NBC_00431]
MGVPAHVVFSRTAGGAVYLLEWVQLPDETWGAEVAFTQWNWADVEGKRLKVVADDLRPIEGQDYTRVPRRRAKRTW